MRKTSFLLTASVIAALTACATPDSNPYYKVSSKYPDNTQQQGQPATTQAASYEVPVTYRNANAQGHLTPQSETIYAESIPSTVYASSNGDYVSANQHVQHSQQHTYTTPAPQAQAMVETGGQNAGYYGQNMQVEQAAPRMAQFTPQPTPQNLYQIAPQVNSASFPSAVPAPAIAAPAFNTGISSQGIAYIVQESDTVYSLSRRTCSSVAQIQQINGLNTAFLIKAGETIRIPASTC